MVALAITGSDMVLVLRTHLTRQRGRIIFHARPRRGRWTITPCGVATENNDRASCYQSFVSWFRADVAGLFARPCRRCWP